MTRQTRHRAARFVAVAILALAVVTISGLETATAADSDAQPPSPQAEAMLVDHAAHGTETVGVQPPRASAFRHAASSPTVGSVTLAVAAVAAVLACMGACRGSRRRVDHGLPERGRMARAGPCSRRAPPLAHAA